MANDVRLQEGHPVDENLRPLKVGGKSTAIETAQHGNGARVNGDLEVTGDIKGNVKDIELDLATITSTDFTIDASGDITLDADGGNISLLDGGSTYAPTAASDAVPLSHMPFVLYSQFQDDLSTSQHYLPLKGYFEQSSVGGEPAGMIAPFNMKLQKVIMRCSEDISGAAWTLGMWAIASGAAHAHHHTSGKNHIAVTGGAAETNATFDFTGTVNLASGVGGGSNVVTAGQWIDFSLVAASDVTTSSAEFWITIFFIADLSNTI